MQRDPFGPIIVTVHYKSGALSANFHWPEWAMQNMEHYEYRIGVPCSIKWPARLDVQDLHALPKMGD